MKATIRRFLGSPFVNFFIVILVIASMTLGIQATLSQRSLAQCVAKWADRDATATAERNRAAQQDRELDKIDREASLTMYRVLRDSTNPQQRSTAFNTWIDTLEANNVKRQENDKIRTMNPPPAPPSLSC